MKRFILTAMILGFFTASAMSQVSFGIQGDLTNLNVAGGLKDIYGLGYGGGVHFDVGTPIISFRLSGDYIMLSPDQDNYRNYLAKLIGGAASEFSIDGGKIEVISATANLKLGLLPLPVIHIYATGGGGIVRLSVNSATVKRAGVTLVNVSGVEPQTKPSVNIGAGADLSLGGVSLYGELKINWILTEGETSTMVPLATIGLTF